MPAETFQQHYITLFIVLFRDTFKLKVVLKACKQKQQQKKHFLKQPFHFSLFKSIKDFIVTCAS